MRNLSGLLILLKKGRLGDTFPDSFTTLDLRITTAKKVIISALLSLLYSIGMDNMVWYKRVKKELSD